MSKKLLSLILCLLLISCSSLKTQQEIPVLAGIQDLNRSITFTHVTVLPDNMISLIFVNNSKNIIWFPTDWDIGLYIMGDDGQWQEIKNQLTYSGENLLDPGGLAGVYVQPDLAGVSTTLRVVILGNVYKTQPTESRVGAYVDIDLVP
jgi:hypothetical protein